VSYLAPDVINVQSVSKRRIIYCTKW